jgi:hypothetical protein
LFGIGKQGDICPRRMILQVTTDVLGEITYYYIVTK